MKKENVNKPIHIRNERNNSTSQIQIKREFIHIILGQFSSIINSEVGGPLFLDQQSAVNRSNFDSYNGVGCFSYICDSEVGRYNHFGSRTSIGGFNHPTNWLSCANFQYQDTSELWGISKTISDQLAIEYQPKKRGVKIMHDVWVGDNSVILSGVTLGVGCVVAAGSVVTRSVQPYAIVAGNPARIKKYRFEEDIRDQLLATKWWMQGLDALQGIKFSDVNGAIKEMHRRNHNGLWRDLSLKARSTKNMMMPYK